MKKIFVIAKLMMAASTAYCQQAVTDSLLKLVNSGKDDSVKVNALLALNKEYLGTSPTEAIRYAQLAKELSEKINYHRGRAYAYKGLGLVYVMQGKYVETIENYEHSLAIFDSLGDKAYTLSLHDALRI
mgnify:FL=1